MSSEEWSELGRVKTWRQVQVSSSSLDADNCPKAEGFVAAVRGELTIEGLEELVQHASHCSACAVAWRIARQAYEQEQGASPSVPLLGPWRRVVAVAASIAAAILLVISVDEAPWKNDSERVVERNVEQMALESTVKQESLPRDAFLLSWSAPEEDLRYSLTISTDDLTWIDGVEDWASTEYQVREDLLEGLPANAKILWKVETTLKDGRSVYKTFVNRIE